VPEYALTEAGRELDGIVQSLGVWGQRWLSHDLAGVDLDVDALLWDMRRRVRMREIPKQPMIVRFAIGERGPSAEQRALLLRRSEVSVCRENPGFPEEILVQAPLATLAGWWRGDFSLARARTLGMRVSGKPQLFARLFERALFAEVPLPR
jgi:hypothetical protein